ncbi:MAG: heme exporter protein CcmD [Gammaproteobacteria bacterium]|jgi:heme exporter protein D|nr:heme exporter protein CcmD [Gammaproteobacteria bacterium]
MSFSEFLDMGGYALYVWSSYGLAAVVLIVNLAIPIRQRKKLLADVARRVRRAARI